MADRRQWLRGLALGLLCLGLALGLGAGGTQALALNHSTTTTCAEEDNVLVPITASRRVRKITVAATHPRYGFDEDNCQADFSGCDAAEPENSALAPVTCETLWDDGVNVFLVCSDPAWWRPHGMTVTVGGTIGSGHRLVWARRVRDEASWPECAVAYQDGNLRLKPHPPKGRVDCCYGSSVLIGPVTLSERAYADVERIEVDAPRRLWTVHYRVGGQARLRWWVDRERAVVKALVGYETDGLVAAFNSMWVRDGSADVDSVRARPGTFPILGPWSALTGPTWFFHRRFVSDHNTSAPDITVSVR